MKGACACACVRTHVYARTTLCARQCVYVCVCMCVYVCVYVCVCVCIRICICICKRQPKHMYMILCVHTWGGRTPILLPMCIYR